VEGRKFPDWESQVKTYAGFDPALQGLVCRGLLDFKAAERNAALPADIFDLLSGKPEKLSHSERRIFLDLLREIRLRDRLTTDAARGMCDEFLSESRPVEAAERSRFPELTALQEKFSVIATELKKSGITLQAPPYFEGDAFTIGFSFAGKKNYNRKLAALSSFGDRIDELSGLL